MAKSKYTDERKRELVELWESGKKTSPQIEKEYGVGTGQLSQWRTKIRGETLTQSKTGGKAKAGGKSHFTDEQKRQAVNRLPHEHIDVIAKEVGVNKSTIYGWKKVMDEEAKGAVIEGGRRRKASHDTMEMAVARVAAGESVLAVAADLGKSKQTILNWRAKLKGRPTQLQVRAQNAPVVVRVDTDCISVPKKKFLLAVNLLRNARQDVKDRILAGTLPDDDRAHSLLNVVLLDLEQLL